MPEEPHNDEGNEPMTLSPEQTEEMVKHIAKETGDTEEEVRENLRRAGILPPEKT